MPLNRMYVPMLLTVLALALLGMQGWLTARDLAELNTDFSWVAHTYQVLQQIHEAESGIRRGEAVRGQLLALAELTRDNPSQQQRFSQLVSQPAPRQLSSLDEAAALERDLLARRSLARDQAARDMHTMLVSSTLGSLLCVLAAGSLAMSERFKLQANEKALSDLRLLEQLKVAHDRLRQQSLHELEAQEVERRRVARELHDEIGQLLVGLKLLLDLNRKQVAPEAGRTFTEAIDLVDRLAVGVRNLSLELRPSILDDLGLVPALLWQFERYQAQTGIRVEFRQQAADRRFPSPVETAMFRITQEALTNVARHAQTQLVKVSLRHQDQALALQVRDEGSGFQAAHVSMHDSVGLAGMQERATLLNGRFELHTAPGQGTTIDVEIPLA
jgi:signal transduction histidine kinase